MANSQNKDNKKSSVIVINASSSGAEGNTELILKKISNDLNCEHVYLKDNSYAELREKIKNPKGIILGTGNYWSNYSHYMQKFLEDATGDELSDVFLGKPVALIVTSQSTGGMSVISNLMTTLNLLGCVIPPLSCIVYSQSIHGSENKEFWKIDDYKVVLHNFLQYVDDKKQLRIWDVDTSYKNKWIGSAEKL